MNIHLCVCRICGQSFYKTNKWIETHGLECARYDICSEACYEVYSVNPQDYRKGGLKAHVLFNSFHGFNVASQETKSIVERLREQLLSHGV